MEYSVETHLEQLSQQLEFERQQQQEAEADEEEDASSSGASLRLTFGGVKIRSEGDKSKSDSEDDSEDEEEDDEGEERKKPFKGLRDGAEPLTKNTIKNTLLLMKPPNVKGYTKIKDYVMTKQQQIDNLRSAIDMAIHSKTKGYTQPPDKGFVLVKPSVETLVSGTPQPSSKLAVYVSRSPMFDNLTLTNLTKHDFRVAGKYRKPIEDYVGPASEYGRAIAKATKSAVTSTAALIKRGTEPSALTLNSNVFTFVFLGKSTKPVNAKAQQKAEVKGTVAAPLQKYLHLFLSSSPIGPDLSVPLVTGQVVVAVVNPALFTSNKNEFANIKLIVDINTEPTLSVAGRRKIADIAKQTLKNFKDDQVKKFKIDAVVMHQEDSKFKKWWRTQVTPYSKAAEQAYQEAWQKLEMKVNRDSDKDGMGSEGDSMMESSSSSTHASSSGNLDPADGESSKRSVPEDFTEGPTPKRRVIGVQEDMSSSDTESD
jgi:hypothetical protein